jgi:hypothetical protein
LAIVRFVTPDLYRTGDAAHRVEGVCASVDQVRKEETGKEETGKEETGRMPGRGHSHRPDPEEYVRPGGKTPNVVTREGIARVANQ